MRMTKEFAPRPVKDNFEVVVIDRTMEPDLSPPTENGSEIAYHKVFKKVRLDDARYRCHLSLYPLIIREDSPLEVPLDVGCSVCGIKIIRLEDSGMCRVCDFTYSYYGTCPSDRTFHSIHTIAGKHRVVSRVY